MRSEKDLLSQRPDAGEWDGSGSISRLHQSMTRYHVTDMRGVVKMYAYTRGYGFIAADAPSVPEVFFHVKELVVPQGKDRHQVEALLRPGTVVEFESGKAGDGRERAASVQVLESVDVDIHGSAAPVGMMIGFIDESEQ